MRSSTRLSERRVSSQGRAEPGAWWRKLALEAAWRETRALDPSRYSAQEKETLSNTSRHERRKPSKDDTNNQKFAKK
eukprot:1554059-Amphidinium_carterae.1